MIKINPSNELLRITLSGDLDFNLSRSMLRECRGHFYKRSYQQLDVLLREVTAFNSCAIGALLILKEKVPANFNVQLERCAPPVHALFDSGLLNQYFSAVPAP